MKHHLESRLVYRRLAELRQGGVAAALATVVRVRGSAYRHEGAKLLVPADGSSTGNVSGGCLELDVREVARRVITTGIAETRSYCSGADQVSAWDLGVGCEGEVEILIEPVLDTRARELVLLELDAPFAVVTVLDSPDPAELHRRLIVTGAGGEGESLNERLAAAVVTRVQALISGGSSSSTREAVDGRDLFVDIFTPPPRLVVIGAGDDAQPLVRLAHELGFRVVLSDHRPGFLLPERFPNAQLVHGLPEAIDSNVRLNDDCYVVVMTHHYIHDSAALERLLNSRVAYIGVLGPRQRTDRMLAMMGSGATDDERLHAPVGLDIGTDGAEQVALAILAEIMTLRSGRQARSLRERRAPIHAAFD